MLNLLKAEFFKIKKDKLLYIALIIIAFLALSLSFGYVGLEVIIDNEVFEEFLLELNGKGMFIGSFSPSQNIGILIPIVLTIITTREFSYGTVRNKIISGHKRTDIYLAMTISNLLLGLFLFFVNIISSLLFGSLIVGYGYPFTSAEFLEILKMMGLGLLIYCPLIIFTVFIAMMFRSIGYSLIISLLSILILGTINTFNQFPGMPKIIEEILSFLPTYQLVNINNMDTAWILKSIASAIIISGGLIVLGNYLFQKRDFK